MSDRVTRRVFRVTVTRDYSVSASSEAGLEELARYMREHENPTVIRSVSVGGSGTSARAVGIGKLAITVKEVLP